jgi:hypothetical protein
MPRSDPILNAYHLHHTAKYKELSASVVASHWAATLRVSTTRNRFKDSLHNNFTHTASSLPSKN